MTRFVACAALLLLAGCGGKTAAASDDAAKVEPVADVRVAAARLGAGNDTITAYGVTEAGPGAARTVIAPAEAIVGAVLAPTGTAVHAGQAIVALLPSRASRLDIAKAGADLQSATAAFARAVRLRRDGLVSDAEVETARTAAATARATTASVGIGSGGLVLRASAPGTVQALTVRPGDQIAAGAAIATVAGRGDLRARFGVDPGLAPRIRPGQPVLIQLAGGGAPVSAPVVGVDPAVDAATRLASVFVRVPGGLSLSPGEPLRATMQVGATATGITVPYAALLDDGGRSYVFVVRGGAARRVDVTPGNSAGDDIQIVRGLRPGDKIVVEGGTALEDGMHVRVAGVGR